MTPTMGTEFVIRQIKMLLFGQLTATVPRFLLALVTSFKPGLPSLLATALRSNGKSMPMT